MKWKFPPELEKGSMSLWNFLPEQEMASMSSEISSGIGNGIDVTLEFSAGVGNGGHVTLEKPAGVGNGTFLLWKCAPEPEKGLMYSGILPRNRKGCRCYSGNFRRNWKWHLFTLEICAGTGNGVDVTLEFSSGTGKGVDVTRTSAPEFRVTRIAARMEKVRADLPGA